MKAITNTNTLIIEARNEKEIEKVNEVVKVLTKSMGYEVVDGSDDNEEYYVGLYHHNTIKEAREDYKLAKLSV